jgi:hypothetical protein
MIASPNQCQPDADTLPLIEKIGNEARRYAEMYSQSSDGRNTFIIFAEWVEALAPVQTPTEGDISPAVQKAVAHFWTKATEYDHEKLQAIYNDMHELQDRVETIPLSQALDAMDLALQIIDRLAPLPSSTGIDTP